MADYQIMYHKLFNAITEAINILQTAQLETENMYINSEPANITELIVKDDNKLMTQSRQQNKVPDGDGGL